MCKTRLALLALIAAALGTDRLRSEPLDLRSALVVVRAANRSPAETMAPAILIDEVERRTGIRWQLRPAWPTDAEVVIPITVANADGTGSALGPGTTGTDSPSLRPEGYSIHVRRSSTGRPRTAVHVIGADGRGAMFGVGRLLRLLSMKRGAVSLDSEVNVATSPAYPIRGHQLGYRPTANSYDAWSPEQYEQYIRELIVFGTNCIENTFFQDADRSAVMPLSRSEMNRRLSEICNRYDIDYWVWAPAGFSLADPARRKDAIERHETFYRSCVRLDGVFVPGGDPGTNPPELVLPFLKDLAAILVKHHPQAGVWVSLQGFDKKKTDSFFEHVRREKPPWLRGVVSGPSSPSMTETRVRLPRPYKHRWYPDITHTIRCQYSVDKWDPAFALTLGRECTCPRPQAFAAIFRQFARCTDGFLSYSDGVHDDVNKIVWSLLAWDPESDIRQILREYGRLFFGPDVADAAADAILGLECNWTGSLAENGSVYGVLAAWQDMEKRHPSLLDHWRFPMHLMRAYYDAYTRARLIYETDLEREAIGVLSSADRIGSALAIDNALAILRRAETHPCRRDWHDRIDQLATLLFKSIGLQTSVKRFHASGAERGAVMDFIDRPLNNRWWIEDEFAKIRQLTDEQARRHRLERIRTWETPGPGSFYDDIGHIGKMPHVVWGEGINTDPELVRHDTPDHAWWDDGKSRTRLSWQHYMRWPVALWYEALDPTARYVVRLTGNRDAHPRADGVPLEPTLYSQRIGEFKEFPVPAELVADGALKLTFDSIDEEHLNWRQQSNVAEVWLLKK